MQGEDGHMPTEAKIGVGHLKPSNAFDAGKHQAVEEARKDSPLSLEREHGSADNLILGS